MEISERTAVLILLGESLKQLDWGQYLGEIRARNPWFTEPNVRLALTGIQRYLDPANIQSWVSNYNIEDKPTMRVGIIMAGNIPLVGFHDLLSVLITGNHAVLKQSSQDKILMPLILKELQDISPALAAKIEVSNERLPKNIQVLMATGSSNTARYITFHYQHLPRIIRTNRTSHAVLHGNETAGSLKKLGLDLFSYFGRGCRNISKIWVPIGYDFTVLASSCDPYKDLIKHESYLNNYRYQKALLKTDQRPFVDFENILLCRSQEVVSPIGMLFYDHYEDQADLMKKLQINQGSLQCVVSEQCWVPGSIDFGTAQSPDLWTYADHLDTVAFLLSLP